MLKEGSIAVPYASVDTAKEAGAVTVNLGIFFNHIISFLIVGFAVFLLVRTVNKMQESAEAEQAAAPAKPPAEQVLLTEIRDLLKSR